MFWSSFVSVGSGQWRVSMKWRHEGSLVSCPSLLLPDRSRDFSKFLLQFSNLWAYILSAILLGLYYGHFDNHRREKHSVVSHFSLLPDRSRDFSKFPIQFVPAVTRWLSVISFRFLHGQFYRIELPRKSNFIPLAPATYMQIMQLLNISLF